MKEYDIYTDLDDVCDGWCYECDGGCTEEDGGKVIEQSLPETQPNHPPK